MEQNRKAGQNPPRVVAPTEEEEEDRKLEGLRDEMGWPCGEGRWEGKPEGRRPLVGPRRRW